MGSKITRRRLLRYLASAGAFIVGAPLLAAVNPSAGPDASEPDIATPRIRWFNRERGFGFVEMDGRDLFVNSETLRR